MIIFELGNNLCCVLLHLHDSGTDAQISLHYYNNVTWASWRPKSQETWLFDSLIRLTTKQQSGLYMQMSWYMDFFNHIILWMRLCRSDDFFQIDGWDAAISSIRLYRFLCANFSQYCTGEKGVAGCPLLIIDGRDSLWNGERLKLALASHSIMHAPCLDTLNSGGFNSREISWYRVGHFNTLRPRQSGHHFVDRMFILIFFNENCCILIQISLKCVPESPIYNEPTLVQIMAWHLPGDTPSSEPVMALFHNA